MAELIYAGKVTNKGNQEVKAGYAQKAAKAPKMKTGGDLRARKSHK
jgi:hypothetical protein